jgi:hypothetical protein
MRYPVMTSGDATTYLIARRTDELVDVEKFVRVQGSGEELDQAFIPNLRASFDRLRARWPDGIKSKADPSANEFEASAARLVHSTVPFRAEPLADPGFWTWLAIVHFRDVVEWRYRYGKDGKEAQFANYGIGSKNENFLYRLWLRADLVLDDEAKDRYHLSDSGQVDFYRSHLFRQGYANAHAFARALLRYQYPNRDPSEPRLKTLEIRDLVKRLRRLRANLFVELLAEGECWALIEAEAALISTQ